MKALNVACVFSPPSEGNKDVKQLQEDLPHVQKIDVMIVVDMLFTGFDSKFLNTLYVDKNLKYHGLMQAFSRANRGLNDTKPLWQHS